MAAKRLEPIHPGEILEEEFMAPLGLSANALAKRIDVPVTRISEIVRGNRGITADTAAPGTTPRYELRALAGATGGIRPANGSARGVCRNPETNHSPEEALISLRRGGERKVNRRRAK